MDYLEMDEMGESGDFFFFLEEKTHDEITNIIQQWKNNSQDFSPSIEGSSDNMVNQQPMQQAFEQNLLTQQSLALSVSPSEYKLDSRTFTRPKRRPSKSYDAYTVLRNDAGGNGIPEFLDDLKQLNTNNNININSTKPENLALNMEIGGLVTTMQQSPQAFNQNRQLSTNTDALNEGGMSNSLITSADFTNINFLQSTNSLDFNGINNTAKNNSNSSNRYNNHDDYNITSLNDYKVLDSLAMSGDGTLIKDTHIGQIDDISLPLSRTASGCTTMNNSTESIEYFKQQLLFTTNSIAATGTTTTLHDCTSENNILHLNDENIGEITCPLVENSIYNCGQQINDIGDTTIDLLKIKEINISKDNGNIGNINNSIKEQIQQIQNRTYEEKNCETPEQADKTVLSQMMQIYESTPHISNIRYRDTSTRFKESPQLINNMNLSPIYTSNTLFQKICETPTTQHANNKNNGNVTRVLLNDTAEHEKNSNDTQNGTYLINLNSFNANVSIKRNETFNTSALNDSYEVNVTGTKVIVGETKPLSTTTNIDNKLLETDLNILNIDDDKIDNHLKVNQNEEEFEHMLNEFSRVELNAEQKIKMKKSIESLKKRFHCNAKDHCNEVPFHATSNNERTTNNSENNITYIEQQCQLNNAVLSNMTTVMQNSIDSQDKIHANVLSDFSNSGSPYHGHYHNTMKTLSPINTWMNENSNRERLLNRRSRLYDNVLQSSLSPNASHHKVMNETINIPSDDNDYNEQNIKIQNKVTGGIGNYYNKGQQSTDNKYLEQNIDMAENSAAMLSTCSPINSPHSNEKRVRDRDRFKTININKSNLDNENVKPYTPSTNEDICSDDHNNNVGLSDMDTEKMQDIVLDVNYSIKELYNNETNSVHSVVMEEKLLLPATVSTATTKTNINYLTYRKSKHSRMQLQGQNFLEQETPEEFDQSCNVHQSNTETINLRKIGIQQNSNLTKPHSQPVKKIAAFNKANSADNLSKVTKVTNITSKLHAPLTHTVYTTKSTSVARAANKNQDLNSNKGISEITSMGFKSKSFNNLVNNNLISNAGNKNFNQHAIRSVGSSATTCGSGSNNSRLTTNQTFGFRKPNTRLSNQNNSMRISGLDDNNINNSTVNREQITITQQETEKSVFKVPKPIGGARALTTFTATSRPSSMPTAISDKRTCGLVRPSSGCFSLHAMAGNTQQNSSDPEIDNARHSSTDSMSSSSSKNSAQGTYLYKPLNPKTSVTTSSNKNINITSNVVDTKLVTKANTGNTSAIAKPSGLRPPSVVKRSGLPRPSTIIKTCK